MFPRYREPGASPRPYIEEAKRNLEKKRHIAERLAKGLAQFARSIGAERVIELGCGISLVPAFLYKELGGKVEVVISDKDEEFLQEARDLHKGSGLKIINYDVDNPRDIGKFGVAYCLNMLHETRNLSKSLRTIHEMLEDPGVLYATDILKNRMYKLEITSKPEYVDIMVKDYVKLRKLFLRGKIDRMDLVSLLGEDGWDDLYLIEMDSLASAFSEKGMLDAFKRSAFSGFSYHTKENYEYISLCAAKDTKGRVGIEKTPEFYSVSLKY